MPAMKMSRSTKSSISPKYLYLTFRIFRDGSWIGARFRVVSQHRSKIAAQKKAIRARKLGWLARVRDSGKWWVVAVRRPRTIALGVHHLRIS